MKTFCKLNLRKDADFYIEEGLKGRCLTVCFERKKKTRMTNLSVTFINVSFTEPLLHKCSFVDGMVTYQKEAYYSIHRITLYSKDFRKEAAVFHSMQTVKFVLFCFFI